MGLVARFASHTSIVEPGPLRPWPMAGQVTWRRVTPRLADVP